MLLKRLKLHHFFNGVARILPAHKHGCRKRGRNFKISANKAVLLVLSGKTQISSLALPRKTWKTPLVSPLGNRAQSVTPGYNPSHVHAHKHVNLHHICM